MKTITCDRCGILMIDFTDAELSVITGDSTDDDAISADLCKECVADLRVWLNEKERKEQKR
jgi:hypothetical protein